MSLGPKIRLFVCMTTLCDEPLSGTLAIPKVAVFLNISFNPCTAELFVSFYIGDGYHYILIGIFLKQPEKIH